MSLELQEWFSGTHALGEGRHDPDDQPEVASHHTSTCHHGTCLYRGHSSCRTDKALRAPARPRNSKMTENSQILRFLIILIYITNMWCKFDEKVKKCYMNTASKGYSYSYSIVDPKIGRGDTFTGLRVEGASLWRIVGGMESISIRLPTYQPGSEQIWRSKRERTKDKGGREMDLIYHLGEMPAASCRSRSQSPEPREPMASSRPGGQRP